ncbi:AAA family ATPase [Piscinibacter sp. HJYY11]|uniref:AAA family ATPase n=1 Tax=Piscinibacter sp. HJYY11 TaxID=2801333 RepID=UPI00191D1504|nr:AAA family ATPase [Piscinibacter sp. HJYY11]MBL0726457.1 AAA family ATPase [Piscinibacter sp. HJYY11]
MTKPDKPAVPSAPTQTTDVVLYRTEQACVLRRTQADGQRVVVKQAIGAPAVRRLGHELTMLKRVAHVAGVPAVMDTPAADTLVLRDDGGIALTDYLRDRTLSTTQAVDYALGAARILAAVHKAGVVHKDIGPGNLLIHPETLAPTLIDFNISVLAGAEAAAAADAEISGTWAYMSPEHTGRTGRAPDARSDLYSFGMTLYQVLVGRKPFETEDLLELVHAHLVQMPEAPATLVPEVPAVLSDIVMRLVAKEPEKRYQSAEGLAQDLQRLQRGLAAETVESFELGAFDFGAELKAPAGLVGRDKEIERLRAVFEAAREGRTPWLWIQGEAGVGKSALVDELRSIAATRRAWYAGGRFTAASASDSAHALAGFSGLGRQLVALPTGQLAQVRDKLLAALDGRLGYGVAQLPEFRSLLGEHPAAEPEGDADTAIADAAVRLLRALASAERPVVLVADDLQHAPPLMFKLLAALSTEAARALIPGLLLVAAGPADLAERVRAFAPADLEVAPLAADAAARMIATMLRMPVDQASPLAASLERHTRHCPGRIVALLNALRADSVLSLGDGRWVWDGEAVRRYVGAASPAELQARIAALPKATAGLVHALAALGGHAAWADLVAATGQTPARLRKALAAALDDGLVVDGDDGPALPRATVGEAALAALPAAERHALHLGFARKLDAAKRPEALVATQYFHAGLAADDGLDTRDRRRAAELLEREGDALRARGQIDLSERYLSVALSSLRLVAGADEQQRVFDLSVKRLQSLFELGRHADVDAVYRSLLDAGFAPELLSGALRHQIYSLVARSKFADAMQAGLDLLARLEMPKPADIRPDLGAGIARLVGWYRGDDRLRDFDRPEINTGRELALAQSLPETTTPAYFADPPTWAWLTLMAHKIWVEHGPHPRLAGSVASLPFVLVGTPQDFRGAHAVGRHVIEVCEKRGFDQAQALGRCIFAISAAHWVDSLELILGEFHRARADLMRMREPFVAFSYVASDVAFDCQPTLALAMPEVKAGLDFALAQRNLDFQQRYQPRLQLQLALRGETRSAGALTDDHFDEADYVTRIDPTGTTAATYHMVATIRAALFGDAPALAKHSAMAVALAPRTPGYYLSAVARALRVLSLADQLRSAAEEDKPKLVEELDATLAWVKARATDAPANFAHLAAWLDAERAWALESVWTAGAAFDAAVTAAKDVPRPWHKALIHERAALFRLSQGMEEAAKPILFAACELYDAWGAAGKVKELRRQHAFLRSGKGLSRSDSGKTTSVVGAEMLDLMAVLRASQALSSETVLAKLTDRVGKVLGTITGATGVQLIVRPEEGSDDWVMAHTLGDAKPQTVEEAGAAGELALSAFRYAERTRELLLIEDVVRDERFNEDAFAQKLEQCSMMFSPIVKQGHLHAMLVLENRQRRNAFSGDRLDSVALIAGQLSVSLDNALLYASLEKRVAERTAQLRQKTNDINAMLQNMPQGVLTVVSGGAIHPEYSAYLETIFETTDIAGVSVMDLIFAKTSLGADLLSQVDAAIASVIGEDEMNYEFNSHLLVAELDKTLADGKVKSLALSWSPIVGEEGNVDKLMLCVRDVTELKRLEAEANARKRELQVIGEILAVSQEKFHEFIDSARGFIAENKALIEKTAEKKPDAINLLFRNMHTIKGNARTYGFLGLTNQVHVTEQHYDDLRKDAQAVWEQGALLAELAQVHELIEHYAHVNDVVLGRKGPGRRAAVEKFLMVERDTVAETLSMLMGVDHSDPNAMRLALQHVGSTLHMLGTQPIGEILSGTLESLPSLARELGKAPPQVHIEDHGLMVRTQASSLLKNLFTHLLRNSVDHGIEKPELRAAAGKPDAGRIDLRLHVDDGKLWIHLKDDGRGLALGRIRQQAMEQNLLTRGASTSAEEVAQLIFRSGFSTAEQVTEVSGRGVGMDAVRAFLEKEGGSIAIRFLDDRENADFRPFETVIALPDKFAASLHAAMSFDALRSRLVTSKA